MPQERDFNKFPADLFPLVGSHLYTGQQIQEWMEWEKENNPQPSNLPQTKGKRARKRAASNSSSNDGPAKKMSKAKAAPTPSSSSSKAGLNHYPGKVRGEDHFIVRE
jgi:hypothetical protein